MLFFVNITQTWRNLFFSVWHWVGCTPKNEGKGVHVPSDEKTCGHAAYSLSIDITEEGSDVGDDSDDGDFEPSLNFTLRFVMLIAAV
jgi:hypothetical protein